MILTDSGGVQKEAFFHHVPCITLRDETEWVETVEMGWNQLTGADGEQIVKAFNSLRIPIEHSKSVYGDGTAAMKIVEILAGKKA